MSGSGSKIISAIQKLYPNKIDKAVNRRLIGSKSVIAALEAGQDPQTIESSYSTALKSFLQTRQKYLLYRE